MYYKDYSIDKYAKGGIFKDKLLGSSPNYDGILKLLKQFFYSPNIFLTEGEIGGNYYVINNSKGVVKDYYVFFSKGRYRFFEKDKVGFDERMQEKRDKLEIISKNSKLKNKNFVESMQEFLDENNIKGTATTYGFNISKNFDYKEKVALVEKQLNELGIKYKTDFTNTWNVMFKVDKKQILNYKDNIKVNDEYKTQDIEQVEIKNESKLDKRIKTLEISLKFAGANTRLRIEKRISTLKIAQKYEVKNVEIDSLKDNPEAKIIYDNLPQILNIKSSNSKSEYDSLRVDLALEIDEIMMKEAPANWLGNEPRGKVILNLLYNALDKDKDATLKLFELLKTIPKYQHSSTDIITETYNRVSNGKIDSDEGAIFLNENGIEVTYEMYDELRDLEKKFRKKLKGLEVGDIITVKGKNGNKDFSANFRGKTNDGKLIITYEGGKQMSINSDEYY